MTIHINKWGNSLGIRIPKEWTSKYGWTSGSAIELQETEEGLLLKPTTPKITLAYLLEGMTEDNQHPIQIPDLLEEERW